MSAKVGVLAVVPNAVAVLVFFGALGWFGVPLNLGVNEFTVHAKSTGFAVRRA